MVQVTRPRNKMQNTTDLMYILKKEGFTYFQKYRCKDEENSTKDLCLERVNLWQLDVDNREVRRKECTCVQCLVL